MHYTHTDRRTTDIQTDALHTYRQTHYTHAEKLLTYRHTTHIQTDIMHTYRQTHYIHTDRHTIHIQTDTLHTYRQLILASRSNKLQVGDAITDIIIIIPCDQLFL